MEDLSQKPEKVINNHTSEYECIICYELPLRVIQSKCCQKLSCEAHVPLYFDKCPYCRHEPFEFKTNLELQETILMLQIEHIIKNKVQIPCYEKKCKFQGDVKQMKEHNDLQHNKQIEPKIYIKRFIKIQELTQSIRTKIQKGLSQKQSQKIKQLMIMLLRDRVQPSYGIKKHANQQQKEQMKAHVQNCENEGCFKLWQGQWGPFIGGQNGRQQFDLTECQEGKLLNQAIQWKYDNPAY
ncbi:hypothetical protein PPERSA_11811 [Pseudocohnilembus persalinus]|uniref:Uncharacterized protein n=1 Tax=Pseudocohnilembus persalinus TaxID=266149 RepID=A0A0V0QR41_PSEPJ|nr:hypothetical protein PPERSA_11811 [Pseudocohnilembus persalinus]|eukprot:KRX04755.1 hypothetical protein PPERSA_11811 [Pseudocohnilembus persalinus]